MAQIQAQPAPASQERGRLRKAPEHFLDATGVRTVFAEGRQGRRNFIRSAFAAAMAGSAARPISVARVKCLKRDTVSSCRLAMT